MVPEFKGEILENCSNSKLSLAQCKVENDDFFLEFAEHRAYFLHDITVIIVY